MWIDDFQSENIQKNIVAQEGIYTLRIEKAAEGCGEMNENGTKVSKKYIRIECIINAPGYPTVSVFLTEGKSFNGEATAFFDTFNLNHGDWAYGHWIHHYGNMFIRLKQKDGFTNMVPRYLLGEDGFVDKSQALHVPEQQNASAAPVPARVPAAAAPVQVPPQTGTGGRTAAGLSGSTAPAVGKSQAQNPLLDENGEELLF
jgi:hypothetical protein